MSDHALFLGHDDRLDYLLREYDDGTRTIAVRTCGSGATWSPEIELIGETPNPGRNDGARRDHYKRVGS